MTILEYLLYLKSMKGFLFDGESRFDELSSDDKEKMIKQGLIYIEELSKGGINVELTQAGEDFLESLN